MDEEEVDQEFIGSIALDVMRVLEKRCFFAKLDDLFSPADGSEPLAKCDGTYAHSQELLRALDFSADDLLDVFEVLRSRGGFCDCEILYNASEQNRLEANYWKSKAGELQSSTAMRKLILPKE